MADTKISAMTAASALGGTEQIPAVQSAANVAVTANQIKTFTSNSPTLVTPALGTPASGNLANCTGYPSQVAGSSLTLQYNNAGSFGGMSGTSWDDTNRSLTVTGATVTTSNPVLNLSQTWNAGAVTFDGIKFNATNTASATTSTLIRLQSGGTDQFLVTRGGVARVNSSYGDTSQSFTLSFNSLSWVGTASITNGGDTILTRDAANTWAQRNSTNAQTNRLYGTYTDASNYRRIAKTMSTAGLGSIGPEGAGTGASGNLLVYFSGTTTVASLPSAASYPGGRAFVTDATATTFLSTVAGGGSNKVPVVSDGTNWLIG